MKKKITDLDIIVFTRHLATMLSAGLPQVSALKTIAQAQQKKLMRNLVFDLCTQISGGKQLSQALRKYPQHFNQLYCALVHSAEQSASMDTTLMRLADFLEKTHRLKKKVRRALTYPISIIAITVLVAIILLLFVVPQFEKLFNSYGASLPIFTLLVLHLSNSLQHYWLIFLSAIIFLIFGFKQFKALNPRTSEMIDTAVLNFPIIGQLLKKSILARVMRTLSTNLAAGVPLQNSLHTAAFIADNLLFKKALLEIKKLVKSGNSFHSATSQFNIFPQIATQMIAVGEESGSLELMLEKLADFYEEDVDNLVDNLSNLLEPLIMIVLGIVVGSFVLAMYLPIFKIGSIF